MSMENSKQLNGSKQLGVVSEVQESEKGEIGVGSSFEELEMSSPRVFGDLSPEALKYIQRLQSEISNAKQVSKNCYALLGNILEFGLR